ncbi:MAG: hypothetical protein ABFD89_23855 [Bryobacteraceae bacterium]
MMRPRFSDAQDLAQMARMLDEYAAGLEREKARGRDAAIEVVSRCVEPLGYGTLVKDSGYGVLARAGGSDGIPCTGIVTGSDGATAVVRWSPLALVWLDIEAPGLVAGPLEIWLGENGRATASKPQSGLIQPVGVVLGYDAIRAQFHCLVQPGPVMGILRKG